MDIVDAIDYVGERMREAPSVTFPTQFRGALAWFEGRSGTLADERLTNSEQLQLYLAKAVAEAGVHAEAIRRAPRFPLSVVAALEDAVVNAVEAAYRFAGALDVMPKSFFSINGTIPTCSDVFFIAYKLGKLKVISG